MKGQTPKLNKIINCTHTFNKHTHIHFIC